MDEAFDFPLRLRFARASDFLPSARSALVTGRPSFCSPSKHSACTVKPCACASVSMAFFKDDRSRSVHFSRSWPSGSGSGVPRFDSDGSVVDSSGLAALPRDFAFGGARCSRPSATEWPYRASS